VLPAGYTDEFMGLTGWNVDTDGYVAFYPLEEEVLAIGKPSTGLDMFPISADQIQNLFSIAEASVKDCEKYTVTYYWIFGSVEYGAVESYYRVYYEFANPETPEDSILFCFDAVSGDFIGIEICNPSKDEALRIANELFKIFGGTYTITGTLVEEGSNDDDTGLSFSGYDGTEYGVNYYSVFIDAYNDDRN